MFEPVLLLTRHAPNGRCSHETLILDLLRKRLRKVVVSISALSIRRRLLAGYAIRRLLGARKSLILRSTGGLQRGHLLLIFR